MKELRCILFNEREVATAIIERRRRMKEPLPPGTVEKLTFENGPNGTSSQLVIVSDDGTRAELRFADPEVASALVAYCLGRRVPLPVDAEKFLQVVNDHLALMIRVNFQKKPKPGAGQSGGQPQKAATG